MEKVLVVGDIHGCIEELDELLKIVSFVPGNDRLVTVGDFLDRGPDSVGCVRRLRELKAEGVMGNHEQKHLLWLNHWNKKKADPTYKIPKLQRYDYEHEQLAKSLSEDDIKWIKALPLTYKVNDKTVVAHAGLETGKPFEKQGTAVLRCSWLKDEDGLMAPENRFTNTHYWTSSYKGPYNVIYGHKARDHRIPTLTEPVKKVFCLGIDTGCVWGGHLTALYLPSNELVQVRAKKEYKMSTRPLPLFKGPKGPVKEKAKS
jgi:bis(5'-nucleosyl)-tetraphosphatase (symmetrical)